MKKARFYPLTDATYTIYVYKDDEIINETAVEDYTVGKWNEVELSAPIVVENGASYRLAVDCYDVVPNKPAIALDSNAPMEGYSDIYTLDGESWSSITSTGVSANWMIGLVLETAQPKVLPIDGYDVYIDNAKKNTEKVAETTFTHDFGTDDKQQHTIRVDVYYTVKSKSVKGGVTKENGASYRLAVDCYDVVPNKPAIALDSNAPMEGYSDIYTLDGESWSSITSTGVSANWMIGLVLETAQPKVLPIDGYDVYIDNAKKNTEKVAETTFTHDFGTDDKQQHTIRVDVYYTVKSKSVKGGVTKFLIAVAGINENTVGRIEMHQGENELTVTGENVESVELVSAAGAVVAKANGDTVSLNGVPAGMYVVKAVVAGETVTRKVMLTK